MNLKLTFSVALIAIAAFALGTKVNGQPPDPEPRKATIGLMGYTLFFVDKAYPGLPAEKAGLKNGDLVLSINNHTISSPDDLRFSMAQVRPGQAVEVRYMRPTGEKDGSFGMYTVMVETVERPIDPNK